MNIGANIQMTKDVHIFFNETTQTSTWTKPES